MRKTPFLLLLLPAILFADEVYLEGGATFSGRIIEQTETMVKIDIGDGVVGVPTSRVERIVKGRSALDEYDEIAGRLEPQDVKGWRILGRWASQQGLSTQSRQAYEKVLATAPDDAEAREALGFVKLDGRWVTEEESYRARGYVKYEGEWMTPAEVQVAQASAAADQAQREADRKANEAAIAALKAEAEAEEEAERARDEEDHFRSDYPVYWGGYGYGLTYWPSTPVVRQVPATRPAQRPARGPR